MKKELEKETLLIIGKLAPEIIHKLNNPLAVISSTAQYLLSRLQGKDLSKLSEDDFAECLDGLRKIVEQAGKCGAITSKFLQLLSKEENEISGSPIKRQNPI